MVCLLSFFLVQGLVDEHVRHQESVAASQVSDFCRPYCLLPCSSSGLSSSPFTFQFRVIMVSAVFKVLSQDRILQRLVPSRSLLRQFQVVEFPEVFKVCAQVRIQQRLLEVRRSGLPRRLQTFHFLVVFLAVFLLKVTLTRLVKQIIVFGVHWRSVDINTMMMEVLSRDRVQQPRLEMLRRREGRE